MAQELSKNSFGTRQDLDLAKGKGTIYSLESLEKQGVGAISTLPVSIKILLEGLLRQENGFDVTDKDILSVAQSDPKQAEDIDIPFLPARVLLQDFTGVPSVVDLAALRSAMKRLGGDPSRINPQVPVDLVIDHSVQVDVFNQMDAEQQNTLLEMQRNRERYEFLRWGQGAFENFRVIPPGAGICHQVNLEYLATVTRRQEENGQILLFPDSLVGTDSHTTMINGLGVLGWGVGGIEAEAVMLGKPISMLLPKVVGFKLEGKLPAGATATDLVLRITERLRQLGVVGKFVEFFGEGLSSLTLADRATIANMAPEYGATMGYFPVDEETLRYLRATGRPEDLVDTVERYTKAQGLFHGADAQDLTYHETVTLDLSTVEPSLAGPKRPQDRISLTRMKPSFHNTLVAPVAERGYALHDEALSSTAQVRWEDGEMETLRHGSVVLAAITSCTNTSNPSVMIGAGLLAKNAVEKGLTRKRSVKTSLAPGSRVVTDYLTELGLLPYLEKLGFGVVGYGCTTCIGNSGPLPSPVQNAIAEGGLVVAGVLSGNRNFEGRIHPFIKANYLASPPLVVAHALAGRVDLDFETEAIGQDKDGQAVYLRDIWPDADEVAKLVAQATRPEVFHARYDGVEQSNAAFNDLPAEQALVYPWNETSTYIQEPPFFVEMSKDAARIEPINKAHVLVNVGDSVTTDHISPAGSIAKDSPAAQYLREQGVAESDFNSYGSRRGNDRVMTRGTFANVRLKNQLAPGTEGGFTTHIPTGKVTSIYEASRLYKKEGIPTVVLAGKDYGMGSSRDWAAKGTFLLGVKAVIAESYERIHRSNLIGMGVLPLEFLPGQNADSLGLTGKERFTIELTDTLKPLQNLQVQCHNCEQMRSFNVRCRLDTPVELESYRQGGILHGVLRKMLTD